MIYEVQHSHVLRLEALDPASLFSTISVGYTRYFLEAFEMLFTKHPQYHRLEFTVQHYTTVAEYIMFQFLDLP